MSQIERRYSARRPVKRPVKLRCVQSGRYMAGQTKNVSASGALLEICQSSLLVPGQSLEIGIAWGNRQAVLNAGHMLKSCVVRSLGMGGIQYVAVQFEQMIEMAATV